ncbi:hypothetical protein MCUN1_002479 [Malassezia cuniculi]|uniref:RRM domain-containing protein n=1 Tax=Malassezia cuniculi TaxID=948313 RepID=A0AAF0EWI6_9BASI|nr:hypothetical protein MCUN1_002479 [Malassezia cuniculi]
MEPQHVEAPAAASAERGRSTRPVPPHAAAATRSRSRSPSHRGSSGQVDSADASQRWNDRGRRERIVQPMRDVILLGLDADVDADGLRTLVSALADSVGARLAAPPSDVTVIRDRVTGASKGFGFAKFDTLEDAKRFVSMYAPYIDGSERWLGPPRGDNQRTRRKRIKIDYSDSERPQGGISYYEQHNAPGCREQLKKARARRQNGSSSTPRGSVSELPDMACENPGRRETAMYATPQLLLTGIPADAAAADIGAALCQLRGTPESPLCAGNSLHSLLLIRNRDTRASTGVCIAVYSDANAARAALGAVRTLSRAPGGLLGNGAKICSSYADHVILEEADPYDPTCAAWTFTDARGDLWRHEDERLGFDVWTPSQLPARSPSPLSPVSEVATPPAYVAPAGVAIMPAMPHHHPLPSAIPMTSMPSSAMPTTLHYKLPPPHAELRTLDYSDCEHRICLLCQRQFKSVELLLRHALESTLHQSNLDDEAACRAGAARVRARSLDTGASKENYIAPTPAALLNDFSLRGKRASMPELKAPTPSPIKRGSLQVRPWNGAPTSGDIGLPDIDTAADVYETHPESEVHAPSSDDRDRAQDEHENEHERGTAPDIERHAIDAKAARAAFRQAAAGPALLEGAGEGPKARLLRLQMEVSELAEQVAVSGDDNAAGAAGLLEQVHTLQERLRAIQLGAPSKVIRQLAEPSAEQTQAPTAAANTAPPNDDGLSTTPVPVEPTALAELDKRLARIESRLGVQEVDGTAIRPVIPTLKKLESQLQLLSPAHLDAVRQRARLVISDLEQVSETRKRLGDADEEKLSSLYELQRQIEPLIPVAPALLTRLQTLESLHSAAATFADRLATAESSNAAASSRLDEISKLLTSEIYLR